MYQCTNFLGYQNKRKEAWTFIVMADIKVLMVNSEVEKFECIEYLALERCQADSDHHS